MKTAMVYSLAWEYRERWRAPLPPEGAESEGLAYIEGQATGPLSGRFRRTNAARQRSDGRFLTEARGVILLPNGSVVSVDYRGVGRPYPSQRRTA